MLISLHKQATTTPKVWALIQAITEPASVLAARCAILGAARAAMTFDGVSFPTCYGKEFTDRLFGLRQRAASGEHDFDRLCDDLGIAHRRSPPMHPQTNGKLKPELFKKRPYQLAGCDAWGRDPIGRERS